MVTINVGAAGSGPRGFTRHNAACYTVAMEHGKSTVERALELARDGTCRSNAEVRTRLMREGYPAVEATLGGFTIKQQLKRLFAERVAAL